MVTATAQAQTAISIRDEIYNLPTLESEIATNIEDDEIIQSMVLQSPSEQEIAAVDELGNEDDTRGKVDLQALELMVNLAIQGDQVAFGQIVDQYSTLMLRTASMIVGDRDIAEDVVQDALIQAWHHLSDLRKAGALRPWLMRIVVNQCISFKRRLARTAVFMRQVLSEQETDLIAQVADNHKGCRERDWDLAHAIESLPMKQRVVIVLHYYNSMTLSEMAQTLNTSENTLKKRIQAGLTNLRRILRNNEEEENTIIGGYAKFAPSLA
jgi:RNA polymerase sigma-70 factor (ECF subfamily)